MTGIRKVQVRSLARFVFFFPKCNSDVLLVLHAILSSSQLHESTEREKVSDRYPAFELVLNFVKNESLSVERLHALLQQRSKVARSMAQTYYFVAEVVRMMGVDNLFEVSDIIVILYEVIV